MNMDKFASCIDSYVARYDGLEKGKTEFECDYGELVFYKSSNHSNTSVLHGIYIAPKYRHQGYCRSILQYIIDKCMETGRFTHVCVQSVMSKVLYDYLGRFQYKQKGFRNTPRGFMYNLHLPRQL